MEEVLNILYEFLFVGPSGVTMGIGPLAAAGIVKGVGAIVGGLFGAGRARRARRRAAAEKRRLKGELNSLEKSRQKIINPYENTKDLSSLAKDLSGKLSNPYGSLSVSTAGAAMQVEEADIALANTLDTLRATGASAGGATALAQAALQSKKGVAANIEQQEAANEKARAQGEQQLQNMKISEQQRLQGIKISEGQRIQQAEAAGKQFAFGAQESRETAKLDRIAAQLSGAQARESQAASDQTGAITSTIGSLASLGGSYMSAKGPKG